MEEAAKPPQSMMDTFKKNVVDELKGQSVEGCNQLDNYGGEKTLFKKMAL